MFTELNFANDSVFISVWRCEDMFLGLIASVAATQAAELFVAGSSIAIAIYEAVKSR